MIKYYNSVTEIPGQSHIEYSKSFNTKEEAVSFAKQNEADYTILYVYPVKFAGKWNVDFGRSR
jgi:hypothetical protein